VDLSGRTGNGEDKPILWESLRATSIVDEMGRWSRTIVAFTALAAPGALCWYGFSHCVELSCVGPMADVVLDYLVVVPLLVAWLRRSRPVPLAMLFFGEAAMAYATFRSDFDFSPQFRLLLIPAGLVVGIGAGSLMGRTRRS